jgi:hypothetical protein
VEVGEEMVFESVDVVEKEGFEGAFRLPSARRYSGCRVAALGGNGQTLGISEVVGPVEVSHVLLKLRVSGCPGRG